jgi:hypothetical protein
MAARRGPTTCVVPMVLALVLTCGTARTGSAQPLEDEPVTGGPMGPGVPLGGAPAYGGSVWDPPIGGAPVYGGPVEEGEPVEGAPMYGGPVWDPPIGGAPVYGGSVEEEEPIEGAPVY